MDSRRLGRIDHGDEQIPDNSCDSSFSVNLIKYFYVASSGKSRDKNHDKNVYDHGGEEQSTVVGRLIEEQIASLGRRISREIEILPEKPNPRSSSCRHTGKPKSGSATRRSDDLPAPGL